MTHQINDKHQNVDAQKFFSKGRRLYIEVPLKTFGFKKYKSSVIGRLTKGNIFQFLYFQKSAYGGQNFTVNVAIRPLYCPNHEYLTLLPGNRLGSMVPKSTGDTWWNYTTETEGNKSFKDLFEKIEKYALPFFESTQTSNDVIASYEKNIFGISKFGETINWGTIGWEDFDLGHIYLYSGQIKQAVKHFNSCYEQFSKDDSVWAQAAARKCLEMKELIDLGQSQIDKYFAETIDNNKKKLNLTDW